MPFRYVPLLRSKIGEAEALARLDNQAQNRLLPVFHVVERPPATFATRMVNSWSGRPMALDGQYSLASTGSYRTYVNVFDALGQGGVNVIPSIECDSSANHVAVVMPLVGRFASGLVVKANLAQVPNVGDWVSAQGWNRQDVDLLVFVGEVSTAAPSQIAQLVNQILLSPPFQPTNWRSITLALSAAPLHLGGYPVGRTDVQRTDWQTWQAAAPTLPFQLDYADYAQLHPSLVDPPGIAMSRAPVSVRYTTYDHWILLKGVRTSGPNGVQMGTQYIGHANSLINDPHFGGVPGCWGDAQIQQVMNRTITSGNRSKWAGYLMNRHLSHVAHFLP